MVFLITMIFEVTEMTIQPIPPLPPFQMSDFMSVLASYVPIVMIRDHVFVVLTDRRQKFCLTLRRSQLVDLRIDAIKSAFELLLINH